MIGNIYNVKLDECRGFYYMGEIKRMRKRFGRNDIIMISVIVIISVALLLIWKLVYLNGQDLDSDACVEVTIDGRAYGTYPLSKDDTIEIKTAMAMLLTPLS